MLLEKRWLHYCKKYSSNLTFCVQAIKNWYERKTVFRIDSKTLNLYFLVNISLLSLYSVFNSVIMLYKLFLLLIKKSFNITKFKFIP